MKHLPMDIEEEDFIIKLHPKRDKNNKWTGDVQLGIITSQDNPLSDHDYYYMMEFASMVCATVPMMEHDPSFREQIEAFMEEEKRIVNETKIKKEKEDRKKRVTKTEGNVIKISFFSLN